MRYLVRSDTNGWYYTADADNHDEARAKAESRGDSVTDVDGELVFSTPRGTGAIYGTVTLPELRGYDDFVRGDQ